MIPTQEAIKSEHVRLRAIVTFDVEIELEEEIQQFADGTFMVPPRQALQVPAIEEAKRRIAMGNCQASFKLFDLSVIYEKDTTQV